MCRVYQNRTTAAYSSLYFFLFLSHQFSKIKDFRHIFFSGTVRPRRLKLCTHMDSGQMYHVYRNQAAALIHPFISSFFFLSNFQTLNFCHTFLRTVRPRRLKLSIHVDVGRYIVYTGIRLLLIHPFVSSFFFLSNFQTLHCFVTFFSGTVKPRRLKLCTHIDSGQMYFVYQN